MPERCVNYAIYIQSDPHAVWDALFDPDKTRLFWGNHRNVSDWRPGSPWRHEDHDDPTRVSVTGTVIEIDPPRRLVLGWSMPEVDGATGNGSQVTIELASRFGAVHLRLTHAGLQRDAEGARIAAQAWPAILSSLKTLLETGKPMPMTARRWVA